MDAVLVIQCALSTAKVEPTPFLIVLIIRDTQKHVREIVASQLGIDWIDRSGRTVVQRGRERIEIVIALLLRLVGQNVELILPEVSSELDLMPAPDFRLVVVECPVVRAVALVLVLAKIVAG